MAVFGTNYAMSFDGSKEIPKWTYLVEKKFKISQKQKSFIISQINGSKSLAVELVGVKIWSVHLKALVVPLSILLIASRGCRLLSEERLDVKCNQFDLEKNMSACLLKIR